MTWRAGSLFAGIGGLDLAVRSALGIESAWMCEYDPHCRAVLERRFPGVPVYPDVRELGADTPPVDVLHGGYPCQPFSVAGKRQGADDPRHLWPEFARLIRLLRPRLVVAENVAGHLRLGFADVLADLAALGMDVRWGVVRASDAGAPHQRARLFVVATDASGAGAGRDGRGPSAPQEPDRRREPGNADTPGIHRRAAADADGPGRQGLGAESEKGHGGQAANGDRASRPTEWGAYSSAVRRWEHVLGRPAPRPTDDRGRLMPEFVEWMMGLPEGWTDGPARTHRLRMLGNAVVPQQAALALRHLTSQARPNLSC